MRSTKWENGQAMNCLHAHDGSAKLNDSVLRSTAGVLNQAIPVDEGGPKVQSVQSCVQEKN